MMADLATLPETATREPWLKEERLDWLEVQTQAFGQEVEMPKASIVPGDSPASACLEICRTVVRRAERLVVRLSHDGELRNDVPLKYLNRLSSLLFVMGRVEDKAAGVEHFTLARGD
jgi:cob(I)alamin adenosyltransferase